MQSGRSITVNPREKKKHTMMTTKLESIDQPKKMHMASTFRTTIKNVTSETSDALTKEASLEAQREKVRRITSNLPEVYNKYFFTAKDEHSRNKLGNQTQQQFTIGMKKGFSLNRTQKDYQNAGIDGATE